MDLRRQSRCIQVIIFSTAESPVTVCHGHWQHDQKHVSFSKTLSHKESSKIEVITTPQSLWPTFHPKKITWLITYRDGWWMLGDLMATCCLRFLELPRVLSLSFSCFAVDKISSAFSHRRPSWRRNVGTAGLFLTAWCEREAQIFESHLGNILWLSEF